MKSKALTYLMLIVVAVIWYQVFFRVKDNLMGEDVAIPKPNETLATIQAISRDTVQLGLDYRDPFHYEKAQRPIPLVNDVSISRPTKPQRTSQRTAPQFVWPKISYHGLVRNRKSKQSLGLIRVDGLVYNLRNGDEIYNSIYVKSITPDSLIIGFKKLRKTIPRI